MTISENAGTIPVDPEALPERMDRSPLMRAAVAIAAFSITTIAIVWSTGLSWRLRFEVYTEQYLALMLGLSLFIVYLTVDYRRRGKALIGRIDGVLAVASLAVAVFISLDYARLTEDLYFNPWETFIVGGTIVALTVEGLRRSAGLALVIVFAAFFFYALIGHLVPGILQGRPVEVFRLVPILGLDATALLGMPMAVVGAIVIAFIFMGQLLFMAGGGEFFNDLSKAIMGRQRGGAAKICVVSSAFFGTISGSVVANVTSSGIITIPMMKRAGFRGHVAAAIEATSSNGGQIMPPVMGAAAFLMADFLGVPYSDIVLAALIPAVLYFLALFIFIDLEAARDRIDQESTDELPRIGPVLRDGWVFLVPFVILIVLMFEFDKPPELAALFATVGIFVLGLTVGYRKSRLSFGAIFEAMKQTGITAVQILIICGIAGMIIGVLNITGLGFALSLMLTKIGEGSMFLLLTTTAVVSIILGMSMPTTSLYILLSTLVVPSLTNLGALPIAAHMFVFYYGMMSFVTPPVAIAAFAAANLAKSDPMKTAWAAMRIGWVAYIVPYLFVYSPSLLMIGDPFVVALSFASAAVGIVMISAGMVGFLKGPLNGPMRALAGAFGAGLLVPLDLFPGALYVNGAAFIAGAAFIYFERRSALALREAVSR